jgi:hypothetical protein
VPNLAAVAGVAETTVRNAIREARRLGLVTVEERRLTGFRNDTNVVTIVSAEWIGWLRLTRRGTRVGVVEGGRVQIPVPHAYSSFRIGENAGDSPLARAIRSPESGITSRVARSKRLSRPLRSLGRRAAGSGLRGCVLESAAVTASGTGKGCRGAAVVSSRAGH